MKARAIVLTAAAGIALALTGCGAEEEPAAPAAPPGPVQPAGPRDADEFSVTNVQVGDRVIPCVVWKHGYKAGGVSCDWTAAAPETTPASPATRPTS